MAQFVTTIRTDLDSPLGQYTIGGKMFTQDNKANRINVELYKNKQKVNAEGEITGIVKRNDGKAVAFPGGIENGDAYVVLPETAYAVEGPIDILVRERIDDAKTVIAVCKAYVTKSADADYVTAGSTVVSIEELVAALDQLDPLIERMQAVDVDKLADITSKLEDVDEKLAAWNEKDAELTSLTEEFDAQVEEANNWINTKVNKPTTNPNGTAGQVLRTNGNGTTTWIDPYAPTDSQATTAINAWLTAHPEATTTVADGSITGDKLSDRLITELQKAAVIIEAPNGLLISHILIPKNVIDVFTQPQSADATVGDTVTLSIVAYASGTEIIDGEEVEAVYNLSYQWQSRQAENSVTWTNVGANSDTLSISVTANTNPYYRCVITCGETGDTKVSDIATLSIQQDTTEEPPEEPLEEPIDEPINP